MDGNSFSATRKFPAAALWSLSLLTGFALPTVAQPPQDELQKYTIFGFQEPAAEVWQPAQPASDTEAKPTLLPADKVNTATGPVGRVTLADTLLEEVVPPAPTPVRPGLVTPPAVPSLPTESKPAPVKPIPVPSPLVTPAPKTFAPIATGPVRKTLQIAADEPALVPAVPGAVMDSAVEEPTDAYSRAFLERDQPGCVSPFAPNVQYNPCVPPGEEPPLCSLTEKFLEALAAPSGHFAEGLEGILHAEHDEPHTELNPHAIGIQPIPHRPPLLLETNEDFLGPGFLSQGICTPTGAIWRPALWVFGTFRTGVGYFDGGAGEPVAEWANRLDLFSQLNLSGTERLVLGLRPLDEEESGRREFTSYDFRNGHAIDATNMEVQTLFFEGDFGEIFPLLDPYDYQALDYGFSVGRQPMLFQQGLLLNEDRIDALTITKNTLNGDGNLNLRSTFVYAWSEINRTNLNPASPADGFGNQRDSDANLVGFFTESDFEHNTVNADVGYVWSDDGIDDMVAIGISGIRRFYGYHNTYNSSLHFLASLPTNGETNIAGQGELLFSQFSWTPHHTNDLIYLNSFWAIDQFTSLSRGPLGGGPLGQTGLLFSAAGLGRYGAPLANTSTNVVGASLGYQMFFDHTRQQVILELGARQDTDEVNQAAVASGVRYQKALNQHWLVVVDGFVAKREDRDFSQGSRVELQMKF